MRPVPFPFYVEQDKNDILYIETKTQCLGFWPRLYTQCVLPSVALGTDSLKIVVEAVYFGHFISSNLKDDPDVYKYAKNYHDRKCSDTQIR